MCSDQMFVTFSVTFVVIGNCIELTNCYNDGINDFKSLRFKLLCKSYLILMDVFTYHQVQVGTDLDLCPSFFGANL